MAAQPDIPTPWIGTDDLPVHFANAFGVGAGPNAIFLLFGSSMSLETGAGGGTPFIPVRPIVRLAMAPAALPELIEALETVRKAHEALSQEET